MRIQPDCIPCILKMAVSAIRNLTEEEEFLRELTIRLLAIPALRGQQWDLSSPEVIEQVMVHITEALGTPDPFQALKAEQNRLALGLYPTLKKKVREASDPLQAAVRLAITGNAIDLMIADQTPDVEQSLQRELQRPLPGTAFEALRNKLEHTRSLVYLGDNAGEIVFDRLLLETMRERYDLQVLFVVRDQPALNDATRNEALAAGLDQVAALMTNGVAGPVPGTVFSRCAPGLQEALRKADLIISKGGGNFDTLEGEKELKTDISFLLLSKCIPYCRIFNTPIYQPVLANMYSV